MAILSIVKRCMLYAQEATGHVLYRLASQCVEMDNGNDLQTEVDAINNKLSGIKVTKKSYSMALDYNSYVKANIGYVEIPQSDIDKYGIPISVMFKGNSVAPGSAYFYTDNSNITRIYASCVDASGNAIVRFFKGGV